MQSKPRRTIIAVLVAAATMMLSLLVVSGAKADTQKAGLPGGMSHFTVAIGQVDADVRTNWQRLATYVFNDDGTVDEEHWHWTQRRREVRSYTGVQAADCPSRDCDIQTAHGFESKAAPEKLSGTYTVSGDVLTVTWSDGLTEEWTITQAIEGKLAKLSFKSTNFTATHGFGYGSNASLDTRASMADIQAADHNAMKHEYYLWKTESDGTPVIDTGSGDPFWMRDWTLCGGEKCLGGVSGTPTEYFLTAPNSSATDRRDTIWHWVRKLADDRGEYCYTGNSHVKPMMQIIDSDGGFHGWVGVEASLSQTSTGTDSDDVGLIEISEFAA